MVPSSHYTEDENGHYFILVDAHSRWPEIYFMQQNTSAMTTIAILRELFAKYGLPVHCVIENSPQFRSEELSTRHQSYRAVGIWPAVGQR